MPDLLFWIVFGALVGWIAFLTVDAKRRGPLPQVVAGMGGAVIGGMFMELVGGRGLETNMLSMVTAVIGAMCMLALVKRFTAPNNS